MKEPTSFSRHVNLPSTPQERWKTRTLDMMSADIKSTKKNSIQENGFRSLLASNGKPMLRKGCATNLTRLKNHLKFAGIGDISQAIVQGKEGDDSFVCLSIGRSLDSPPELWALEFVQT